MFGEMRVGFGRRKVKGLWIFLGMFGQECWGECVPMKL